MKAVVFSGRDGSVDVDEIPAPILQSGQVLVRNRFSLVSAGTERARVELGHQGLIAKARERPDQARQVLDHLRRNGPLDTYRTVRDRLDAPSLMGYSCAGIVASVAAGVDGISVGDLVACGGGGYANHAEVIAVPRNLCVRVPSGVGAMDAAFATVGAISLHGIHQAAAVPGSRVAVVGLGLVGQLTVRILKAYGYDVVGIDTSERMLDVGRSSGAAMFARATPDLPAAIRRHWGGSAADAVMITAATKSNDPIEFAGEIARDRASVVVVGDVGVAPPRPTFYGKEISIAYSRSYGPGRYDRDFEERGLEYPVGYVPWTERRNLSEVLRLISVGALDVSTLTPAVFPVEKAKEAYAALEAPDDRRPVAILISYSDRDTTPSRAAPPPRRGRGRRSPGDLAIGAIGAGSFPTRMLFPHLKHAPNVTLSWIMSASGLSAANQARRWEFADVVGTLEEGLSLPTDAVMVLSAHDTHAQYAADVLRRGVPLYCEKPLGRSEQELDTVADSWMRGGAPAMVGFNRRFASAMRIVRDAVAGRGPLQIVYRVFAPRISDDHWFADPAQGGRIVGEVCHFIDAAGFLVGARATQVSASAGRSADPASAQNVSAMIEYEDGSVAVISYSGSVPSGAPKELIEVGGDGVAARIEDFREATVWGRRRERRVFRRAGKGHAEEMSAFAALARGERIEEADFRLALWSSLVTCKVAESVTRQSATVPVIAELPALTQALVDPATR